ncbi:RNA-binding protein [Candidatus Uhrbacteria bacterium CG_4_9_14_3_um_filter_36_7]|uniref:RNA-binding protein n=1 Tax=Candidatus Uhrbacteria bacterium CG_4_9_14_3_um_filter_36_7 TaxID=1975033 RepID=A0A2M7XI60_9BACT|nr:MAG: RNA-binding protein [Candidatus Uhrbacteria bacterium CG_4_9_14_3_um_filter_36_7]
MVQTIPGNQVVIFEVNVHSQDVRRVIGRRGRTADALRELMISFGGKINKKCVLEIVEPAR